MPSFCEAEQFRALLDAQTLEPANAIVVLRNWDQGLFLQRYKHGLSLYDGGFARLIMIPMGSNTQEEARDVFPVAIDCGWKTLVVVTHRSHHYRAYLTWGKVFEHSGCRIISSPVETEGWSGFEIDKINEYQRKGHIWTYKEGIKSLQS